MKRENKAYSYQEQIIELELQEVTAVAAAQAGSVWVSTLTTLPSCVPRLCRR